jgi:2-polyprenyl-3-methyl-5-hydroxy-6-metoxy-1,4-benzoquinol methylase
MSYYYQPNNNQSYQEYVLSDASDRERLLVQHDVFKPTVMTMFERVLDEYGLCHKLEQAKAQKKTNASSFQKVRILDIGCGEGLFLYDLAALLEARGLIEVAELVGIDVDSTAINTANEFCKESVPPRPYLKFVNRDITQPFQNEREGTTNTNLTGFDFIFAIAVIEHLPDARQHIQRIYQHLLRPSGAIFLRDAVLRPQEVDETDGWVAAHPAMDPFYRQFFGFMQNKNLGVEVAKAQADWLGEMGANKVATQHEQVISGGLTPGGVAMLRNWVLGIRSGAPFLISRGLITQALYDEAMRRLFEELDGYSYGHITLIDTLAAKPPAT